MRSSTATRVARSSRSAVRRARFVWAMAVVAAAACIAAAFASGAVRSSWDDFRNPQLALRQADNPEASRLVSISGNGRYQYWAASVHAFDSAPIAGVGA